MCVWSDTSLSNNLCDKCKKKQQLLSEYKNGSLFYSKKNTATKMHFFFSLNLNNVRRTQIKISSKEISAFYICNVSLHDWKGWMWRM